MQFKVKSQDEKEVVFEKTGCTHEFTLTQLKQDVEFLKTKKKEATAQVELENAKIENYKHFHSFLKDLTEEQMMTAMLCGQALRTKKASEQLLETIAKAEKEIAEDYPEIEKQTGVKVEYAF